VRVAGLGSLDREGRVAAEGSPDHLPAEEVLDDAQVRVVGPGFGVVGAPVDVEELLEPLRADRGLEVLELEVGEPAGELVEAGLVLAVGPLREPLPLGPQVGGGLCAEGEELVALVAHGLADYALRLGVG
jgi:hypothetical protein